MQYHIRGNPWVKGLAVLLFAALGTAAVFGTIYTGVNFDAIFWDGPTLPYRGAFVDPTAHILWTYLAMAAALAAVGLLVFLLCCAGRRPGQGEAVLNWSDQIPSDLYLALLGGAGALLVFLTSIAWSAVDYCGYQSELFRGSGMEFFYALLALCLLADFALLALGAMSVAARCKARTLLKNTLLWRLGGWAGRLLNRWWDSLRQFVGSLDVTLRVVVGFGGYLIVNAFLAAGLFRSYHRSGMCLLLLVGVNTVVLGLICRWTLQWSRVRAGTEAIVSGHPDTVIDTSRMQWFPSLRTHAEELGDLGSAVNTAVEERLRSERMKTELITNVSHDLKTPLTSIINYVDLLKKMDLEDETAREYIEVLDRKSQRLKKLTEDLVEASKASTGSLPVTPERLGMGQLVNQALGEYTERFQAAGLIPVVGLPQEEVWVWADGRHVWRILDNLMGNCLKYALPGTRVYLDLMAWDGYVTLSVKNISAQQLNIPPEQLMERFVRGDESRTTEGSGLGLSIARSLCELQGGAFRLEVDGDLFKAVVSLPQVK